MFDDILVPIDGSNCASLAVDYATDIAQHYDATVHVVNVIDSRLITNASHYNHLRDESNDLTEPIRDRLEAADLSANRIVRTAIPYRGILMAAADYDVDLIVIGTHGRTGVDRYLLGSVTEKVVRRSDVPVLTVRTAENDAPSFPYSDILVPTDGSAGAAAAFEPGIDIATTYDATLHSLSVVETNVLGFDSNSSSIDDRVEPARAAIEEFEERATEASVPTFETTTESGTPSRAIRSYVVENDVDLVVMGTHGRSGLPRYLLGSVAEKLIRTSPVPVMTVRKPA